MIQQDNENKNKKKSDGGTSLAIDTKDYEISGKKGFWEVCDYLLVDGSQFYLMESQQYHKDALFVILDAYGKLVVDDNKDGFDAQTIAEIRKYMYAEQKAKEESQQAGQMVVSKDEEEPGRDQPLQESEPVIEQPVQTQKSHLQANMMHNPLGNRMLLYQKYHENGMYERAVESTMEQNYDMIDGNHNNVMPVLTIPVVLGERISVIWRLRQKQNEVARKYGRPEPYQDLSPELSLDARR